MHCNKCQEYGHFREKCSNTDHCANCAHKHITTACPMPNVCPVEQLPLTQALTEANAPSMLNMQPLSTPNSQNALPYFPILNQPWTFVAVPRNPPAPSRSTVPPVDPNNIAQDNVLMCPSPTSSAQQPPVPQGPHPRTQLTLQDTSCVNVSISFSCDQ